VVKNTPLRGFLLSVNDGLLKDNNYHNGL